MSVCAPTAVPLKARRSKENASLGPFVVCLIASDDLTIDRQRPEAWAGGLRYAGVCETLVTSEASDTVPS